MTIPTPQNIEISTFFHIPTLIPWVLFIPIIFFSYRKCYGVGFKKNILALAQLYEAMSVSYLVSLLSAGILAYVSADGFLGSGVEKWLGGWTLSAGILPGLIFACAYLTTRQYGYVRILKPISKFQAFVFMIIWCITIVFALGDVGIMFTSYDPITLIFTPVTLLLAIAIYRYSLLSIDTLKCRNPKHLRMLLY